ncbi:hypothetical protein NDN08_005993 [Rhodosorus marinus]|uniref:Nuclear pore complex protein n=1 Tax=Rhodosorus marinus TaxID=101924 RepID=A0AAV8UJG1_9RHOD|nr:hypothetical protein NDN08_005993 [Rhodosorus marinus]
MMNLSEREEMISSLRAGLDSVLHGGGGGAADSMEGDALGQLLKNLLTVFEALPVSVVVNQLPQSPKALLEIAKSNQVRAAPIAYRVMLCFIYFCNTLPENEAEKRASSWARKALINLTHSKLVDVLPFREGEQDKERIDELVQQAVAEEAIACVRRSMRGSPSHETCFKFEERVTKLTKTSFTPAWQLLDSYLSEMLSNQVRMDEDLLNPCLEEGLVNSMSSLDSSGLNHLSTESRCSLFCVSHNVLRKQLDLIMDFDAEERIVIEAEYISRLWELAVASTLEADVFMTVLSRLTTQGWPSDRPERLTVLNAFARSVRYVCSEHTLFTDLLESQLRPVLSLLKGSTSKMALDQLIACVTRLVEQDEDCLTRVGGLGDILSAHSYWIEDCLIPVIKEQVGAKNLGRAIELLMIARSLRQDRVLGDNEEAVAQLVYISTCAEPFLSVDNRGLREDQRTRWTAVWLSTVRLAVDSDGTRLSHYEKELVEIERHAVVTALERSVHHVNSSLVYESLIRVHSQPIAT